MLEEGLATVFSEDMIEQWFGETDKRVYTGDVRYRDAAANVRKLLQLESDAIKRLREKQPVFKLATPAGSGCLCWKPCQR